MELSVLHKAVTYRPKLRSEKVTNTKSREFSEALSRILNSVLLLIAVRYFSMNIQDPKQKGLSEIRFGSMIFLFRMAGNPFKFKKVSPIFAVYMITVVICSYSTFIGMSIDACIHWNDLGRAIKTVRALFPFANAMWIYSYCR